MADDKEKFSLKNIEKHLKTISKNTREMSEISKETKNALNKLSKSNEKVGMVMLFLTFMLFYVGVHQIFSVIFHESIFRVITYSVISTLIIFYAVYRLCID